MLQENLQLASRVAPVLHQPARDLALLLDASLAFSSILNRDELLNVFCQKMIDSVESTFCRIYLLEDSDATLMISTAGCIRDKTWEPAIGARFSLDALPWHHQALRQTEHAIVLSADARAHQLGPEYSLMHTAGTRSVLLMPLITKTRKLGVAALSEMRSADRTHFYPEKVELCRAMARVGALALENLLTLEAITFQQQQMKLIVASVADGIFSTDLEGRITAFNPAAERITGYAAQEILGCRCDTFFKGRDLDGCAMCEELCPIQKVTKSDEIGRLFQCKEWITRADESRILVAHDVAPFVNQNHQIVGAVSVIRDISREEELLWLKSEFIALVSHQLRTPMTNVSLSAELLADGKTDAATEKDLLENLKQQCRYLAQLVEQVLETTRLENGHIHLVLEPLALRPLVEQVIKINQAQHAHHSIQVNIRADLPFALGDQTSVESILENLIQNAINYSPQGSSITISAEEKAGMIVIAVADHGEGIPANQLEKIFQRFYRFPNSMNTKSYGFGLGLYIAKGLVEAQGGEIWAESELGQGARFCFTLKKEDSDAKNSGH